MVSEGVLEKWGTPIRGLRLGGSWKRRVFRLKSDGSLQWFLPPVDITEERVPHDFEAKLRRQRHSDATAAEDGKTADTPRAEEGTSAPTTTSTITTPAGSSPASTTAGAASFSPPTSPSLSDVAASPEGSAGRIGHLSAEEMTAAILRPRGGMCISDGHAYVSATTTQGKMAGLKLKGQEEESLCFGVESATRSIVLKAPR